MPRKFPVLLFVSLLTSCGYQQTIQVTSTAMEPQTSPATSATTALPTQTFTPQPRLLPITVGPEQENFPTGVNPLTGLKVADSTLLEYPAVLVSISNMPVTARPQAGPAFVPWIFELYIGEGSTRFMGVFYGDHLREVPNVTGGCNVRAEIYRPQGDWIGNRVWLDENENGQQDAWEMGVGGVCVRLLNGSNHEVQSETTTDSNGYFAFENPGTDSIIQILKPDSYQFTKQDLGNEDRDSDVDVATGETKKFRSNSTDSFWDAGLILTEKQIATSSPVVTGTPPNWFFPSEPYVGPVRSGRLTYNQIGGMFPNSCLVYASAAYDVAERLDSCEIVYGVDKTTPNSALLPLTRLRELAKERLNPKQPVNYSGNLFSDSIPEGGQAAHTIDIYFHLYSQSGWEYDPISHTYLRYTDMADTTGELMPAIDRLTGRQMVFENVIVLLAEHERFRHNQLEIILEGGQKGFAYLFRDGQVFKVQWSTLNREWEKETGLRRPFYFVESQNNLIPLHPGRTWIHLMTPYSSVTNQGDGAWLAQFVQPADPKDTPVP